MQTFDFRDNAMPPPPQRVLNESKAGYSSIDRNRQAARFSRRVKPLDPETGIVPPVERESGVRQKALRCRIERPAVDDEPASTKGRRSNGIAFNSSQVATALGAPIESAPPEDKARFCRARVSVQRKPEHSARQIDPSYRVTPPWHTNE